MAEVFAVEETAAQVTWRRGGAGSRVIEGLAPGRRFSIPLDDGRTARGTTLVAPPGPELCRVATVSDTHIGGVGFGWLPHAAPPDLRMHDRCLTAAIDEATAWGADLLVVKGDLTEGGRPAQWEAAAEILGRATVPVIVVAGNHDIRRLASDGSAALADVGIHARPGDVIVRDLPGLRVVAADVTVPGHHHGTLDGTGAAIIEAAAGAEGGVLVAMHHHLQRFGPWTHWPPGITGTEANPFLDALAAAHPASLVTSGHTHRHRRRRHGPVVVTEVGSTKDFPGTWAGYVVHEGGIRQVVRRVADPDCLAWTESTRRVFLGTWGTWAAWSLGARCFSHPWP